MPSERSRTPEGKRRAAPLTGRVWRSQSPGQGVGGGGDSPFSGASVGSRGRKVLERTVVTAAQCESA